MRCTQEALELSAFHQSDQIKSIGGLILGAIVETRKKPPGEITRKIFSLSQDPSNFVRMNMCNTLRILFQLSGEYEEKVLQEIIKLVGDECPEVLEESLQLFLDILPRVRNKQIIIENIEEFFVKSRYDNLIDIKIRFVGRIMDQLKEVLESRNKDTWLD